MKALIFTGLGLSLTVGSLALADTARVFSGKCVISNADGTQKQDLPFAVGEDAEFQTLSFIKKSQYPYAISVYKSAGDQEVGFFVDPTAQSTAKQDPHPVRAYSSGPAVLGRQVTLYANIDGDAQTVLCGGYLLEK